MNLIRSIRAVYSHQRNGGGYILVMAIVFLGVFFCVAAAYASLMTINIRSVHEDIDNAQALALAEAGVDEAVYQLNQNTDYTGETDSALGPGTFTVTVSTVNESTKQVTVTGFVPNSAHPLAQRTVHVNIGINAAVVSFRYGVQVGAGGFNLFGNATINGNVYANGNIIATNGVHINGSATAADPPALTADQTNDTPADIPACTSTTCITFADINARQDVAQSFRISSAISLNNVEFYLKKVGTPSDAIIRITSDDNGSPGDTIMSGTLSASAITTQFGWVSVPLPSTPILDPNQTYWVVIDAGSAKSSKYYILGANDNGYANGEAKVGKYGSSWSDTSPSGLDGYFRIYLGGGTSMIGGGDYITGVSIGSNGVGDAWAHTVQGATVAGSLYCQSASDTNKPCDTSRPDPTPEPMPVSDSNIAEWKSEAAAGGVIEGDFHSGWAGATLGPKEIDGNLLVDGGGTLTVSGTLWVTGTVTIAGGGNIELASSYGPNDGVIVTDGPVSISGGAKSAGSGVAGSYPFIVTTSACPAGAGCNSADAITLSGGAGTIALIAQNGTAEINGGSSLKEVTAKEIIMGGGATLTYDSGLISSVFSSGPGGSWEIVPGTYSVAK